MERRFTDTFEGSRKLHFLQIIAKFKGFLRYFHHTFSKIGCNDRSIVECAFTKMFESCRKFQMAKAEFTASLAFECIHADCFERSRKYNLIKSVCAGECTVADGFEFRREVDLLKPLAIAEGIAFDFGGIA